MITVICPVFNEEKYIGSLINFFVKALPEDKELFIIDGGSTDNTRKLVEKWMVDFPGRIHLLHNPNRFVPFALNQAIGASSGDPVIRLDAHTDYADDYFEKILETFRDTGAEIVGGPMHAVGRTPVQKAIAIATSTKFGIGNSSFHDVKYKGYADTVYLGAWKREIFNDVGLFDLSMRRNQDDEFHYRAISKGKKIFLNPDIRSRYYPRDSYKKLFSQYYQYGLYKPLVLKKVKSGLRLRHFIPALFVIYMTLLPVAAVLTESFTVFIPLFIYILTDVLFSYVYGKGIQMKLLLFPVYPVLHISYGTGFIAGLFKFR